MVLVPLLIKFCKVEDKKAFSSAVCIILPLSIVSLYVYYTKDLFPFREALPYLIGGTAGGLLGGIIFKKTTPALLHKFFGAIILIGGIRLLWK